MSQPADDDDNSKNKKNSVPETTGAKYKKDDDSEEAETESDGDISDSESQPSNDGGWFSTGIPIERILQNIQHRTLASQLYSDFLKYVPFLVMFVFFFLGLPGTPSERNITDQHYVVRVVKDRILGNFAPDVEVPKFAMDTAKAEDWTWWASTVVVPNLWDCTTETPFVQLTHQSQNYLIGAAKFRSLRVRPNTCNINTAVWSEPPSGDHACYGTWGSSRQEKEIRFGFPDPSKFPSWSDLVTPVTRKPSKVAIAEIYLSSSLSGEPVPIDFEILRATFHNDHGISQLGEGPQYAGDGNPKTDWSDEEHGTLTVVFPTDIEVSYFTFMTSSQGAVSDPIKWIVSGSSDGLTWVPLRRQEWKYSVTTDRRERLPWFTLKRDDGQTIFFSMYKFEPTELRGEETIPQYRVNWEPPPYSNEVSELSDVQRGLVPGKADAVQISEFRIRGQPKTVRFDSGMGRGGMANLGTIASNPSGYNQDINGYFPPSNAIDGDPSTKWVDTTSGSLIISLPDISFASAFTFTTADDKPWRDPVRWTLEGAILLEGESTNWILLYASKNDFLTPLERGKQLPWFSINNGTDAPPYVFSHYRFTAFKVRGGVAKSDLIYQFKPCGGLTADALSGYILGDVDNYHCGGYEVQVPFTASCQTATDVSRAMASTNFPFVDNYATRLVTIEFFLYNPQFDDFVSAKFFSEVAACGMWVNKFHIRPFRIWSEKDLLQTIFDFFFLCFVFFFIYRFIFDWRRYIRKRGLWYNFLLEVWNILELTNLITFMVVFGFRFVWWAESERIKIKLPAPDVYPSLDKVLNIGSSQNIANAVNMVITFLKFLKYVRLNSKLNLLTKTLSKSKEELMCCLLIFVYIVFAFSLTGNALFGANIWDYRTVGISYSSLLRMLLGDYDFESLKRENRFLAGIFFWAFVVLALFLMLNFLVAILTNNLSLLTIQGTGSEIPFDEQMAQFVFKLKRSFHPARISHELALQIQGRSVGDLLDQAVDNLEEYWRNIKTCSDCAELTSCICSTTDEIDICGRCGATPACSMSGGNHPLYYTDPTSRLVFRNELRFAIGSREYDLLGENLMDDIWQEILWDWDMSQRFAKSSGGEQV